MRVADLLHAGQRNLHAILYALRDQSLLRWEVVVERAVRQACGLHDFSDAYAGEPALAEEPGSLANYSFVLFRSFGCWIPHEPSRSPRKLLQILLHDHHNV